jgi:hypothetical protein
LVGKSLVRPSCFIGGIAALALCAVPFVSFPVRADNARAGAPKDARQALPKSLDNFEAVGEMHDSVRNLKQLAIALHDWADAHRITPGKTDNLADPKSALNSPFYRFPPALVYGKDGKGKYPHSWRVELLPYLKAKNVYDEYHFDEPWNSPANKNVMAKMPEVFRNPADDSVSFNTAYFVLVGRLVDEPVNGPALQTMFSSKVGVAIEQVTDGTANTVAVVEANRDTPWTKPEDFPYDPAGKLPQLGGFFQGGFCVTHVDGSSMFLYEPIKDSALKAMISPAADDAIDYRFRPQRIPSVRPGN